MLLAHTHDAWNASCNAPPHATQCVEKNSMIHGASRRGRRILVQPSCSAARGRRLRAAATSARQVFRRRCPLPVPLLSPSPSPSPSPSSAPPSDCALESPSPSRARPRPARFIVSLFQCHATSHDSARSTKPKLRPTARSQSAQQCRCPWSLVSSEDILLSSRSRSRLSRRDFHRRQN